MFSGTVLRMSKALIGAVAAMALAAFGVVGCIKSEGDQSGGNGPGNAVATQTLVTATTNRTTGVAPLGVFFDASATTVAGLAYPMHQARYQWDFGDGSAGTWGDAAVGPTPTGSPGSDNPAYASRNLAEGAVAAHVYQAAGTYTARLTVTYNGAVVGTHDTSVTVGDPTSLHTVCIAAGAVPAAGDGDGCPADAVEFHQVADWPTIVQTYAVAGNRVLLRYGDTFTDSSVAGNATAIMNAGPGIIGAYGPGFNGVAGGPSAKPIISWTGVAGNYFLLQLSANHASDTGDWRIMDLDFEGDGVNTSVSGIVWQGTANNVVVLRNNFNLVAYALNPDSNFADAANAALYGAGFTPSHTMPRYIFVQDNTTSNSYLRSVYGLSWNTAYMGNNLSNTINNGEHVARLQTCRWCVVNHNQMRYPGSQSGTSSKEVLTIRAPVHGATANPYNAALTAVDGGLDSQYIVVSDNYFIGGEDMNQVAVSYWPQADDGERVVDTVTERNIFTAAGTDVETFLRFGGYSLGTIRNNIFVTTGGFATGVSAIIVRHYGTTIFPQLVWVYNNTVYADDAGTNFDAIDVDPTLGVGNIVVANNLIWAPAKTAPTAVTCNATSVLTNCIAQGDTFASNSSAGQAAEAVRANTPFVSQNPATGSLATPPSDFQPCSPYSATPCYATGSGTTLSAATFADYYGVSRTGLMDMGAINH